MKKALLIILFVSPFLHLSAQVNTHSLSFDAIDNYVDVANNATLNPTNAITIQAWIKANAWGTNVWDNYIVGKDDWATSAAGYALRGGAGGELSLNFASLGVWQEVTSSPVMSTGVWYNVAGTFDGSTLKIYINGVLSGSLSYSGTISPSTYNLNIGAVPYNAGTGLRLFNGNIDQVTIWNTALTANQIMQYKDCPPVGTEAALVGFWNLEEGTGTTTADNSNNSNTGTLMNAVTWSTDVSAFNCTPTGIDETMSQAVSVSPNPSNGNLTIRFNHPVNNGSIKLFNTLGEISYEEKTSANASSELNLKNISAGIYFLQIESESTHAFQRIIVE